MPRIPEFPSKPSSRSPTARAAAASTSAASPVKEAALEAGLHVYQPETIKSESAQEFLKRIAPDAVVIIAYGQIVPARLLTIPRLGWINLHASLLPRYRGAAPIHWAIANGETITGLTTMQIDAGMDTGPILLQRELEIGPDETAPELAARMSEIGAGLIVDSLLQFDRGEISPAPQDLGERLLRADPEKRRRPDRLVAHRPANLQPHARLHSLARCVHHVPRTNVPSVGTPGDRRGTEGHTARRNHSIEQRKFMWCAAKERLCVWNRCNSRGASGSPRGNSQTAHVSVPGERFV